MQRAIARRAVVTSTEKEVIRLRSMRRPMKVEKELPKGRMIMVLSMSTMKKALTNLKLLEEKEVAEETMGVEATMEEEMITVEEAISEVEEEAEEILKIKCLIIIPLTNLRL